MTIDDYVNEFQNNTAESTAADVFEDEEQEIISNVNGNSIINNTFLI